MKFKVNKIDPQEILEHWGVSQGLQKKMYAESCYFLRVFYGFTVHGMHAKTWMIKLLTYF